MENTEQVYFEDDTPHWYIAMGDRWNGPLSASDVYERVVSQEITWAHYVWKPGQAEWKRLCDIKTFQAAVPGLPTKKLRNEVTEISKPDVRAGAKPSKAKTSKQAATKEERSWFLYYNDTQFGPFTETEINRFLTTGKINPRVHAWKGGMPNWVRLRELEPFKGGETSKASPTIKPSARPLVERRKEQREAPRRPMVARILLHNNKNVTEAMCRDISVGGMQVLTDVIPGSVGSKIKLNVSSGALDPFVAEGQIVRILEDNRGFSFRFSGLSDAAKKAIEKYIQT